MMTMKAMDPQDRNETKAPTLRITANELRDSRGTERRSREPTQEDEEEEEEVGYERSETYLAPIKIDLCRQTGWPEEAGQPMGSRAWHCEFGGSGQPQLGQSRTARHPR